jgi:hypothetical protein
MVVFSREFAILQMFKSATVEQVSEGFAWYDTARAYAIQLARDYNVSKQAAAGVIAALSPQLSWKKNKEYARIILQGKLDGIKPRSYCLNLNWEKAWKIANGDRPLSVLGGPKVRAFYGNICGKNDRGVTVDVWAKRVAEPFLADNGKVTTDLHYVTLATAYQTVADALGMVPRHLQAVCWIAVRGSGE